MLKPSPTLLRFVNLFCSAIMSGGLVLTVAALRPGLAYLPLSVGALAQKWVVARATFYLPVCGGLSAISAIILLRYRVLTRQTARFYLIGVGCTILVGLMSMYIARKLDPEIRGWRINALSDERSIQVGFSAREAPLSDHLLVWDTWGTINAARTLAAVMALACFIMANVQPRVLKHDV